jgi:hypothetical protein
MAVDLPLQACKWAPSSAGIDPTVVVVEEEESVGGGGRWSGSIYDIAVAIAPGHVSRIALPHPPPTELAVEEGTLSFSKNFHHQSFSFLVSCHVHSFLRTLSLSKELS